LLLPLPPERVAPWISKFLVFSVLLTVSGNCRNIAAINACGDSPTGEKTLKAERKGSKMRKNIFLPERGLIADYNRIRRLRAVPVSAEDECFLFIDFYDPLVVPVAPRAVKYGPVIQDDEVLMRFEVFLKAGQFVALDSPTYDQVYVYCAHGGIIEKIYSRKEWDKLQAANSDPEMGFHA